MNLRKKYYIFLFLCTFIICSIFWLIIPKSYKIIESSDYLYYYKPAAQNILNLIPIEGIEPNKIGYKYVPLFPIFLSILFKLSSITSIDENIIIYYFSVLCLAVSSIILYEISRIFWSEKKSLFISLIFITYPLILWFIKQPNPESLFTPLLFVSILFFIKAKTSNKDNLLYFLSGLFIGFSMLTRPIAIGLTVIFGLFYLYQNNFIKNMSKKVLINLLLINIGTILVVLPWEYYVYSKENKIILLSTNGAAGVYDGLTFNANLKNYRLKKQLPEDMESLINRFNNQLNINSTLGDIISTLFSEFKDNPITVIKLYLYKSLRALYGTDSQRNEIPISIIQIFYFTLIISSIIIVRKNVLFGEFDLFFITLFIYFWFMATTSLSIVRYMTPIMGIFFIFLPSLSINLLKHLYKKSI